MAPAMAPDAPAAVTLIITILIAVPLGVHSATHQYQLSDRITTFIIFVLWSLPSFWVAHMLLTYACGGEYLNLFPLAGVSSPDASEMGPLRWFLDRVWHLALPLLCYTYRGLAGLSRYARAGMLEVLRQDYIRTARAKGLMEKVVVFKHALKNGLIPVLTVVGMTLGTLLGGAVITETVFSLPGIGQLVITAINNRDYPMVQGVIMFVAMVYVCANLLVDILYGWFDPRIKYE